jgi:hypothetical protein
MLKARRADPGTPQGGLSLSGIPNAGLLPSRGLGPSLPQSPRPRPRRIPWHLVPCPEGGRGLALRREYRAAPRCAGLSAAAHGARARGQAPCRLDCCAAGFGGSPNVRSEASPRASWPQMIEAAWNRLMPQSAVSTAPNGLLVDLTNSVGDLPPTTYSMASIPCLRRALY